VAFFLPSLAGGGAERVSLNLAIGLAARGHAVDLVLAEASGPFLPLVPPAVRIVDLKAPRVLRSLRPLTSYLRAERPAALVGALDHANLVAMTAKKLARTTTRTVITVHCTFPKTVLGSGSVRLKMIPWLLGRLHPWADVIVAVSNGVAEDLARTAGIPRHRVNVIYNPVITTSLLAAASEPVSQHWFCDNTRPVVLGVGRLSAQKNFRLLIDAFASVRREHNARLVLLGEGPQRPALEARIRQLGLENDVVLPGFIENPYAVMSRAAVLVLSSNFEGLPTVLIESLALGTPVVSTDCPSGPREILRDGALGELVPPADVRAMAAGIARVLTTPRQPLGRDALYPYTLEAAVEQFEKACGLHA
jgi:glycosyltransferase involved in cell wall biosynthesis